MKKNKKQWKYHRKCSNSNILYAENSCKIIEFVSLTLTIFNNTHCGILSFFFSHFIFYKSYVCICKYVKLTCGVDICWHWKYLPPLLAEMCPCFYGYNTSSTCICKPSYSFNNNNLTFILHTYIYFFHIICQFQFLVRIYAFLWLWVRWMNDMGIWHINYKTVFFIYLSIWFSSSYNNNNNKNNNI